MKDENLININRVWSRLPRLLGPVFLEYVIMSEKAQSSLSCRTDTKKRMRRRFRAYQLPPELEGISFAEWFNRVSIWLENLPDSEIKIDKQ